QVNFARRPEAIIALARSQVGCPHNGNRGCRPVSFICFSRYVRTSSRNRSPNAIPSIPAATARAHVSAISISYCSLEQGQGNGTFQRGRPVTSACRSTSSRRTACIATRSATWLNVVSKPAISYSRCWRTTCRVHALSLPLLHERRTRFIADSPDRKQDRQSPLSISVKYENKA